MNGVGAIRRWWRHPPARDAVLALAITAALLFGAYGVLTWVRQDELA